MNTKVLIILRTVLALWIAAASAWAQVTIDPPTRSFTKDGGGGSILTAGTGTWTATTTDSWLTITPRTTGSAGTSCTYVVGSNLTADTRQGVISIAGTTHTVTQTGYTATLAPTSASLDLNGGTGSIAITTQAGVTWTAVSNAAWITVSPASGISNGSVSYSVSPHTGVVSRTGSLTIAGKTFTVTQTGADVNLSPKSIEKAYSSDIVQVQVTALGTTTWSVSPQASWISVVDSGNGFGDSTVTLAIGTNPSFASRTGIVNIGSAGFVIKQAGTPKPVLDLLPKEATADPVGAYGNVAVLATPDAPWTAQSMDPWLIISSGSSGSGNGNVGYVASANPTLSPRVGRIQVTPPVYVPAVDLTKQLWTYVPGDGGTLDTSGWMRHLSGTINSFNGTISRTLSGAAYNRENDHSLTFAIQFKVNTPDAINRLLQINRSATTTDITTVYISAQNKLVFQTGTQIYTTDYTVTAATWHQLVITATNDHLVKVYAGVVGSEQIGLVGSFNPGFAPFPADYVTTTSRIKFGYSALPSAGYLSNGGMKELKIYGRTLSADEVTALHLTAMDGKPFGSATASDQPLPTMKMCLRGPGLAMSYAGSYYSLPGAVQGLSLSMTDALTTSEKVVKTVSAGSSCISEIVGNVSMTRSTTTSNGILYWRCQFVYADGATAYTPLNSLVGDSGLTTGGATVTMGNPNPAKPVDSVKLLAYINSSTYVTGYSGSFSFPELSQLANWSRSSDRYGIAQRGMLSSGTGTLLLKDHNACFSNSSGTYNVWARFDSIPAVKKIFTRGTLELSIDTSRNLVISGPVAATWSSPIQIGKWHMITLAGDTTLKRATVYVDGQEIGNVPGTTTYRYGSGTQTDMTLGNATAGFIGAVDEIAFFDGVLTSGQILSIYQQQSPQVLYHTVTQGVVDPAVSPQVVNMPAAGGSTSCELTLAQNVTWTASSANSWITLTSAAQGAGSSTAAFDVAPNPTVYQRQGTVTIAGKAITVVQNGLSATVQHGELVFNTDGGSAWIDVSPEGNGQWQAVSDVSWITVALGAAGAGQGSVFIVADPYNSTSGSRTGSVTVAGQKIYVTQRGYQLSINPQVAQIGSNAGAGEFGVAAPISAVWEAIATEPWITVQGGSNGIGSGTIRYTVAANATGGTRTGRIIVSGQQYTITQNSTLLLVADNDGHGTVAGAGSYQTNATAQLTATPLAGYVFSHWTGDAVGSANPLSLVMDSGKSVKAWFIPVAAANVIATNAAASLGLVPSSRVDEARTAALAEVAANPNAFGYYNPSQIQNMALGRPLLAKDPATGKMKLSLGLTKSSDLKTWQSLSVASGDVSVTSGKLDIKITPQGNAAFYILEGSEGK